MDMMDIIRARKSVRTFDGRTLSEHDNEILRKAIAEAMSPFGSRIFTHIYNVVEGENMKVPSTYGVVKGARTFLLVAIDISDEYSSTLTAGYACEAAVLKATEAGIGTCWLGGTFSRKDFAPAAKVPERFRLIAVIPAGYPADKARFMERMMRKVAGSDSRKPFGELFFDKQWGVPLKKDTHFAKALEAVRLAPSSTNSQPWRAIVDGYKIHFYYKPGQYALLDMGIATCHLSAIAGKLIADKKAAPAHDDKFIYLATFSR